MNLFPKHGLFSAPPPKATLWRYMHLAKFLSLLARRGLFFSGLAHLEDAFEGRYTNATVSKYPVFATDFAPGNSVAVNCWCRSPRESAMHWNAFCAGGSGIAIVSSRSRLQSAIRGTSYLRKSSLFVGRIRYLDYSRHLHVPPEGYPVNVLAPVITKRAQFRSENEVRLVLWSLDCSFCATIEQHGGVYVPVDLGELFGAVVCGPGTPNWAVDDVRQLLRRYRLDPGLVRRSEVDAYPSY